MKIIKYILAILFMIAALGNIISGDTLVGIITFALGCIILPPISEKLKKVIPFWRNRIIRYVGYLAIIIIAGSLVDTENTTLINSETLKEKTKPANEKNSQETKITSEKTTKTDAKPKRDNSAFWKGFDPIVKERIYKLIDKRNCKGLQQEFNVTADNMDRIQNAGGSGSRNLKLLNFLDKQMKKLDCY